jgi:hypothetical protein
VLASRDDQVTKLTEQLFPHVGTKETVISNAAGWAGGRAAAELALLDIYGRIEPDTAAPMAPNRLEA